MDPKLKKPLPKPADEKIQLELARAAVTHVLNAICDDPEKFWLLGTGTESYKKLTAAHASFYGHDVDDIRRDWVPDEDKYDTYLKKRERIERLIQHDDDEKIRRSRSS